MKSLLKSVGKIFLLLGLLQQAGCKSSSGPDDPAPSVQVREVLEPEVSLKADREALEKLRAEVPEQKRQTNDELALVLQLMGQVKLKPSEVQARIQQTSQKQRTEFRNKVNKLRADFREAESLRKRNFLEEQKQTREKFKSRSASNKRTREFYDQQDRARQDFFAEERDRRKDFESEITTQSQDFDAYMREKMRELGEQQRLYSKRYYEAQREKKKGMTPNTDMATDPPVPTSTEDGLSNE